MDSHFHGNDRGGGGNDRGGNMRLPRRFAPRNDGVDSQDACPTDKTGLMNQTPTIQKQ
jgi:hypothetical protein